MQWKPVTTKTKFIVFDNPCNLTGQVYGGKKLKETVQIAGDNEVVRVSSMGSSCHLQICYVSGGQIEF